MIYLEKALSEAVLIVIIFFALLIASSHPRYTPTPYSTDSKPSRERDERRDRPSRERDEREDKPSRERDERGNKPSRERDERGGNTSKGKDKTDEDIKKIGAEDIPTDISDSSPPTTPSTGESTPGTSSSDTPTDTPSGNETDSDNSELSVSMRLSDDLTLNVHAGDLPFVVKYRGVDEGHGGVK